MVQAAGPRPKGILGLETEPVAVFLPPTGAASTARVAALEKLNEEAIGRSRAKAAFDSLGEKKEHA